MRKNVSLQVDDTAVVPPEFVLSDDGRTRSGEIESRAVAEKLVGPDFGGVPIESSSPGPVAAYEIVANNGGTHVYVVSADTVVGVELNGAAFNERSGAAVNADAIKLRVFDERIANGGGIGSIQNQHGVRITAATITKDGVNKTGIALSENAVPITRNG